jgi:ribonuclease HI
MPATPTNAPRLGPDAPPPHIVIFADGACSGNPGPGGWASIIALPDGRVAEIGDSAPQTTNNRMELTAAIKGLKAVLRVEGPVHFYTDSVYVIKGVTAWVHGWRRNGWKTASGDDVLNSDLWQELYDLAMRRGENRASGTASPRARSKDPLGGITWHYVRGHAGIPGNERCDRLAVALSKGENPPLFRGAFENYRIPLLRSIPEDTSVPERNMKNGVPVGRPRFKAFYLSLLDGRLERHETWDDCKRRVDGQHGVRFKKISSQQEEADTLRKWGLKPTVGETD